MISIIRNWDCHCDGCGKANENNIFVIVSTDTYSPVSSSTKLCSKCRRELIKKLITLKED